MGKRIAVEGGCAHLREDSGSKLHLDLKSDAKRVLFADQNASISSFEGRPNKLLRKNNRTYRLVNDAIKTLVAYISST